MEEYHYIFAHDVNKSLKNYSETNQVTVGAFLYSIWAIILQRFNNREDIIFGTTVAGRPPNLDGVEETH